MYFDSENRWSHVACVNTGGRTADAAVTVTAIVTVCVSVPLVPVTLTKYVPGTAGGETPMVSNDVPAMVTVEGANMVLKPAGVLALNVTVPANPPTATTVIMVVPAGGPTGTVIDDGEALIAKSATLTITAVVRVVAVVAWARLWSVPITVTA